MDKQERERLRGLTEAATPGPWIASDGDSRELNYMYDVLCPVERDGVMRNRTLLQLNWNFKENLANDREFIADARTAVPSLLTALDAAEAEIERMRCAIKAAFVEAVGIYDDSCGDFVDRLWNESAARTALENET